MAYAEYKPKKFQLSGLEGISDKTLEMHFGLYEGYVKNTNLLMEQISGISRKKQASGQDPAYAELTRRLGFEFGGMVLHEYYFENLAPKGKGSPSGDFKKAINESFDGFENWQQAFTAVGGMPCDNSNRREEKIWRMSSEFLKKREMPIQPWRSCVLRVSRRRDWFC